MPRSPQTRRAKDKPAPDRTVEGRVAKRGKTAIRRYRASRPVAMGCTEGLITTDTSVCDYGCGHGGDLRFLEERGIRASGWDPMHYSHGRLQTAEVVNLGYVLNVIEDPQERQETLRDAFRWCSKVLIVSVRVDRSLDESEFYSDGCFTSWGTFQKIYRHREFLDYIEAILGRKAHPASFGIAYVFKDQGAEAKYIANRAFTRRLEYRGDLIAEFGQHRKARKLIRLANKLGRVPLAGEFREYEELVERFGSLKRIERLVLRHIDPEAFEGSRDQRKEDIQTYLAMLRLRGVAAPPLRQLPQSIRADIRAIWKSYATARAEAERFLFRLGSPEVVQSECRSVPIGKLVARDLYIHTSAEDELPALLRILIFAAKQIVGEVEYNVLKMATDGRSISFLTYANFDEDPHPRLVQSVRVYLPKADYGIREYGGANVPILHRKETMVSLSYPHYQQFHELTEQEQSLGLLSVAGIGYLAAWQNLLEERRLTIIDYRIISTNEAPV